MKCSAQGITPSKAHVIEDEGSEMEQWVNFYTQGGKFLGGYTLRGTFAGEMQATKELLAAENGCRPEDISVDVMNKKGRDKV